MVRCNQKPSSLSHDWELFEIRCYPFGSLRSTVCNFGSDYLCYGHVFSLVQISFFMRKMECPLFVIRIKQNHCIRSILGDNIIAPNCQVNCRTNSVTPIQCGKRPRIHDGT